MANDQQELLDLFDTAYDVTKKEPVDSSMPPSMDAIVKGEKEAKQQDTEEESLDDLFNKAFEQNPHVNTVQGGSKDKPSFFDRVFSRPLERSGERLSGIQERVSETLSSTFTTDPEKLMAPVDPSSGTDLGSVTVQVLAEPVSLLFDSAGEALVFGAEKAVGVVATDEQQQKALQYVADFMNTEAGEAFAIALEKGGEALSAFQEKYPNEAANLRSIADLTGAGVFTKFKKSILDAPTGDGLPPPKEPFTLDKIGMRRVDRPLAGEDKDLWNMAFNTGEKTEAQMDRTTKSSFPFGRNKQLVTEKELKIVDELKQAGITGNMNSIDAHVQLKDQLDALEEVLIKMSKASDALFEVNPETFRGIMQEKLKVSAQRYPKAFTNRKQAKRLIDQYFTQFEAFVSERGRTAVGLREARKDFDHWLETSEGVKLGESDASLKGIIGRLIRESSNEAIAINVPESPELLKRMSRLLEVKPEFYRKAKQTAETAVGRYLQWVGFDVLKGRTAFSMAYNVPVALGLSVVRAPFAVIGNLAKTKYAAKGKARFTYAMRDIFEQINKKMKTASKSEQARWAKEKGVFYSAIRESVQTLEEQYEREEKDKKEEGTRDALAPTSTP